MPHNVPPPEISVEYARQMQHALVDVSFWKTCLNCEFWNTNPATPLCKKFNALPPPEVLVFSCEKWLSSVPF